MYQLTGGNVSDNSPSITIELTDRDIDNIVQNPFLCTTRGNCYLLLTTDAFTDVAGNRLIPVAEARLVQIFAIDNTPPELLNFDLNIEDATLTLTFSEPVSTIAFNAQGITVQSGFNSSDGYSQTYHRKCYVFCSIITLLWYFYYNKRFNM